MNSFALMQMQALLQNNRGRGVPFARFAGSRAYAVWPHPAASELVHGLASCRTPGRVP